MRFSTGYGPRPAGGGFETFSWYFMRITAIGLIFLVIIHLFINHVTTDVACTSYQLVAGRYANPYWRAYALPPLSLSLFPRKNGLSVGPARHLLNTSERFPLTLLAAVLAPAPLILGSIT